MKWPPSRPRPRSRLTPIAVGLVLALALSSGAFWQASTALYVASTDNGSNTFAAGTVVLGDDDSGAVLLALTNLVPGDSATNCIAVSYTGSVYDLTSIRLYPVLDSNVDNFADHLDITIHEGTGGAFANCTGFVSNGVLYTGPLGTMASSYGDFANGVAGFVPSAGDTARTYRVTITLGADTPDSAQSDSAAATLNWEIRSD